MLKKAKVISFVGATSAKSARQFYEGILGLTPVAHEPSALVFDANGTMLRVSIVTEFEPAPFNVLG